VLELARDLKLLTGERRNWRMPEREEKWILTRKGCPKWKYAGKIKRPKRRSQI
jgi:hypothetical protein